MEPALSLCDHVGILIFKLCKLHQPSTLNSISDWSTFIQELLPTCLGYLTNPDDIGQNCSDLACWNQWSRLKSIHLYHLNLSYLAKGILMPWASYPLLSILRAASVAKNCRSPAGSYLKVQYIQWYIPSFPELASNHQPLDEFCLKIHGFSVRTLISERFISTSGGANSEATSRSSFNGPSIACRSDLGKNAAFPQRFKHENKLHIIMSSRFLKRFPGKRPSHECILLNKTAPEWMKNKCWEIKQHTKLGHRISALQKCISLSGYDTAFSEALNSSCWGHMSPPMEQ